MDLKKSQFFIPLFPHQNFLSLFMGSYRKMLVLLIVVGSDSTDGFLLRHGGAG